MYVYKHTHIKPPLYFTKCAISTCKREEEKQQRNFGQPRSLVGVGWKADHLPPSVLFTLESNSYHYLQTRQCGISHFTRYGKNFYGLEATMDDLSLFSLS